MRRPWSSRLPPEDALLEVLVSVDRRDQLAEVSGRDIGCERPVAETDAWVITAVHQGAAAGAELLGGHCFFAEANVRPRPSVS